MLDILFARTFLIVGMMLCLTAVTAQVNLYFDIKILLKLIYKPKTQFFCTFLTLLLTFIMVMVCVSYNLKERGI